MRRAYSEAEGDCDVDDSAGITRTFTKIRFAADGRQITSPHFGDLFLSVTRLGTETIAHEATHLALGWARRRRLMPVAKLDDTRTLDADEPFCYALGQLARGIVTECYRRKL